MQVVSVAAVLLTFVAFSRQDPLPPLVANIWRELLAPFNEECIVESGVDRDLADRAIYHIEFPSDRKLSCYLKCLGKHLNFVNDDAELLTDNIVKTFGAPSDIVDQCKKLKGKDLCETVLFFGRCGYVAVINWQIDNLK